jgi:WD40 repeat protein
MDVPSGRERARITVNDASIVVGFIGTGQYLLIKSSSDSGQRLHFIDPETGRELSSIHLRKDDWQHFSSDGQRMVAKDGNEVRLLEVPTGKEVAHWDESFNQFFFDFDSSGQWLVLRSASGLIRLIDSASGREKSRTELKCETSDYWRDPVALRADADLLVLACQEGDIRTLVASTGAETVTFKAQGRGLAVSPDARLVITQDEGQSVMRFRETRTGREFGKLATSGWVGFLPSLVSIGFIPNPPGQPAFSADGRYMALPGPKGDVQLVDLSSAYSPLKLDSSYERQAILSRDRRFLAFAGSDQIVRVVDMTTGSEVGSLHSDEPTFPEHISSDGRFLITAQKSMLKLNEIESGREVARLQKTSGISFAQASPDGNYLVISYAEREGGLLASSSLREIMTYPSDERSWKRTFSPDGRLFAVPNRYNYTVQVFDTAGGAERLKISSYEITKSMGPWGAEFSPDGKELAVIVPNTVRIYDIATGTEKLRMKYKLPPGVMGPQSSSFSPDGRTLAIWGTVFKGLCVELHDIDTGKELLTVQSGVFGGGETSEPWGRFQIAFSPDSRLFAVGAAVGDPVRLFEAATGKELAHIELGWGFKGVLFSPDGRTLAAASNNGSVRLLDVESLKVIGNCQHAKAVTHMEFSPDSRFLITSGNAGTALMMDTANGKEIARFEHGAPLTQASFSHDGQSLLTVSDDKIKLWPVDPEWPFQQFCARSGRNLSREEWKSYIGESEPWQPTCPNWRTEKVPDLHR